MTDRELMRQALSAFEAILFEKNIEATQIIARNARYSLREALAQPEQKLIGWNDGEPQYVAPPKREWVGLTDDERKEILAFNEESKIGVAFDIEAKLKEKNT